jgi:glycosyltransferase involved in cell wall biosynthesis
MNEKGNLNIAILGSRGIPAKYGGFESLTESVGKNLVKMDIDVTVFCPSNQEYKKRTYDGVKLRFLPDFEKLFGSIGTLVYDIFSLIKSTFSDFHLIYMLGYSSALFCIIPRLLGKKIVINTDGLEWKRSKWNYVIRKYLKFSEWFATKIANILISDSLAIKKYYQDVYRKNSVYITNGADIFFSKQPEKLKDFNLEKFGYYLVVARLEPENNIDTIVKGFSSSKSKKKLFLITNIKKSKYFLEIENLVRNDNRIVWFGPMYDRKKLNELRANAFIYLHGHSVGGTNPSLLESMACGSAVIAFNAPFNKEVLRNSEFFFKDEMELKNMIEKVEHFSKAKIMEIGIKNRKIIKNYYNWNEISKEYLKLFIK